MPKGPHSYAENYFADLLTEMCRAHVLTEAEAQSLMRSSDDVYLPTGRFRLAGGLDPADIKVADLAFVPRAGRATPLLVIEVGFSQSYDNPNHKKLGLLQNAQHWLEQTKGRVKCVVLISINEDKTLQEADAGDDRENHDTLQNDSEQGMDNDWHTDSASTSSSQSTISEYEAQLARFASSPTLVSHFTYPLTAFVELWRYDPPMKRMVQSGARVTLLPTLSAPDITITRMDLGFSPRTANNEFRLPMAPLAIGLAGSARVRLAYQRYLDRGKASRSMGDMDKTVYPDQEDGNEGCDNL
ncbi:hypothetical protein EV426DRAFT_705885 [Tirmania nivea]|nr:hypothetical protein EV426DRAFT_705885 [Tirmania nivea]